MSFNNKFTGALNVSNIFYKPNQTIKSLTDVNLTVTLFGTDRVQCLGW